MNLGYPGISCVITGGGGSYSDEDALDALAAALVAGNNVDITVDDGSDTITVAVETLMLADISDVTATATEVNYSSGVTSAIQTQLDARQDEDATLTALAAYNTNGLLTQTAADTFAGRTITGTANKITVTNGNGVSGNPTLTLPDAITLVTPTVTGTTTLASSLTGVLRADSGVVSVDSNVTDSVSAASATAAGKVELATDAETTTGTDTTRAITPANLTSQIGSRIQAYDADLATIAGLTATTNNFMVASGSAWASRTPAQAIAHLGLDADIATLALPASTTISAFGASLIDDAANSNARTTLGLVIGTDVQAHDAFLDDIAALADPGADRILFWDDSVGDIGWLTASTGLSISGTSITASGGGGGSGALVLVERQDFTTQTSVSLDDIFTSTYRNYRVMVKITASSVAASWHLWKLRASGSDATNDYSDSVLNPGTAFTIGYPDDTGYSVLLALDVFGPQLAAKTEVLGISGRTYPAGVYPYPYVGRHTQAVSYDGLTLLPGSGTITGTIWVYGLED